MAKSLSPHEVLRGGILRAAESENLRNFVRTTPLTRSVVDQYVAGPEVGDGFRVAQQLVGEGLHVTLDHLGEHTTDAEQAVRTRDIYFALLDQLSEAGLTTDGRVEVSVKISALGAFVGPDGLALAQDSVRAICERAQQAGTTVTVDMEDHTTVDATLELAREVRRDFPWLGVVLQAYLRRTEADARDLATAGSRVRLCKGAYNEPPAVSYKDRGDINRAFARALKVLIRGDGYPMIATHDPKLIEIAQALITHAGRSTDSHEFQMLHGIRPKEQQRLAGMGETMRIYLPFGEQWYEYLVRRMAERPANAGLFVRSLITKG